ncbi:hypothetical protein ACFWBF_36645 [Streptomyces sp. NPDC060028]|uniref:hypothetical protein n=1 Tax=Streptomyces sp. NPDC060028 TaxID=3347041 RepID=UPI0036A395A2
MAADIWVMGGGLLENPYGQLIRADAISHLAACEDKLTASRLGSAEAVTLAHKDKERDTDLPRNFHLRLLAKLSEARNQARNTDEDLVLFADLDHHGTW